jgi:hypothetical protein
VATLARAGMRDTRALAASGRKDQALVLQFPALDQNHSRMERPEDFQGERVFSSHDNSLHDTPSF